MVNQSKPIWFAALLDNSDLARGAQQSKRIWQGMQHDAEAAGSGVEKIWQKAGAAIGTYLSARALADFAQKVVQVRGEMQGLGLAFETMLGGKAKADKMMADVIDFAMKTPFTVTDVAANVKQLIAMGAAGDDVMKTFKTLGDVAAGVNVPISRIAINFGQVAALGKLQGREIRDFAMAGIPIVAELAKMYGVAQDEIMGMVEAGKIGFPDVQKAFEAMAGAGGRFNNMMEKLNSTVSGQMSRLQDQIEQMFNKIGAANEGVIYGAISGAATLVEHYKEILAVITTLVKAYGAYWAATKLVGAVSIANQSVRYTAEINALQALVVAKEADKNADIQKLAIDGKLSQSQAQRIIGLRAQLAEQLKLAQTEAATAQQAVINTKASIVADGQKLSSTRSKIAALREEIAAEIAAGNAKKASTLQEKLNSDLKAYGAAKTSLKTNAERLAVLQTDAQTKTVAANTLQQNINNASKTAGAVATNVFTATQRAAAMAVKSLGAAFKANPIGWIATAVMLAVSMFNRFKKAVDESSDATAKLSIELASERVTYEKLLSAVKNSTDGSKERAEAIRLINQRYGEYLPSLLTEKSRTEDITAALVDANAQMVENIRLKIKSAELTRIETKQLEAESNVVGELVKEFQKSGKRTPEEVALFASQIAKLAESARDGKVSIDDARKILIQFGEDAERVNNTLKGSDSEIARSLSYIYNRFLDIQKAAVTAKTATDIINALVDIEIPKDGVAGSGDGSGTVLDTGNIDAILRAKLASDSAQQEIDAMDDGFAKRMAQLRRNHELEKAEIEANYAELAKLQGGELTAEQQGQKSLVLGFVDAKFRSDAKAERDAILADMMTFTQKYEKIISDTNAKIKNAQMIGASFDNFGVLSDQENEAINRLAEEYAAKSKDYEAFMRSMVDASVEEINAQIDNVKALISQIIEGGIDKGEIEKYLEYIARLSALKDQLKNDKPDTSPDKDSGKEWQDLYSTLRKVSNEFKEIGDDVGGMAGEAIKAAGDIATSTLSIISGVQQFAKLSMEITKMTAEGAATAIQQVERASVILAIIGAVMKAIQSITGILKANREAAEASEKANREYAQSLREIEVNNRYEKYDTVFGTNNIGKFSEAVKIANEALAKTGELTSGLDPIANQADAWKQLEDGEIKFKDFFDRANGIEADFRSKWQKLWGTGDKNIEAFNINDFLDGEMLDTEKLQAWFDANRDGLDQYEQDTIQGLIDAGDEYAAAVEIQTEYLKQLWGDLASSIADNMITAFEETGDAMSNLEDIADDVARNMAKSIIESYILSNYLTEDFQKQLNELLANKDQEGANKLVQDKLNDLKNNGAEFVNGVMEAFGIGVGDAVDSARTSASKGFAQASQDSIDKIDGILTNIQNHTYGIFELMKSGVPGGGGSSIAFANIEAPVVNIAEMMRTNQQIQQANTNAILGHLSAIHINTDRLESMQNDMRLMRGAIEYISDNGLYMKK